MTSSQVLVLSDVSIAGVPPPDGASHQPRGQASDKEHHLPQRQDGRGQTQQDYVAEAIATKQRKSCAIILLKARNYAINN